MTDSNKSCALCGLDVKVNGFILKTGAGDKAFCCEGCKGIYQLLNDCSPSDISDNNSPPDSTN